MGFIENLPKWIAGVTALFVVFNGMALYFSLPIEKKLFKPAQAYMAQTLLLGAATLAISLCYSVVVALIDTNKDQKEVLNNFFTNLIMSALLAFFLVILLASIVSSISYFRKTTAQYIIEKDSNGNSFELYLVKTTHDGLLLLSNKPNSRDEGAYITIRKQEELLNKKIYHGPPTTPLPPP